MRNKHHRRPRSLGGTSGVYKGQPFVVWLDIREHEAWHTLFRNMTPEEIFAKINNKLIDPRYRLVLERR